MSKPAAIYVWLVPSEQVQEQPGGWRIRKWDTEPFPEANYALSEKGRIESLPVTHQDRAGGGESSRADKGRSEYQVIRALLALFDDEGNYREQYQDQTSVAIEDAEQWLKENTPDDLYRDHTMQGDKVPESARSAIPQGWKLVPIEPTDKMLGAGYNARDPKKEPDGYQEPRGAGSPRSAYCIYLAMLEAAPAYVVDAPKK